MAASLSPADVLSVLPLEGSKSCRVVVPDDQLSLAIGKEGQNARLAAKLTGYKIDIKSASAAHEWEAEDAAAEAARAAAEEEQARLAAEEAALDEDLDDTLDQEEAVSPEETAAGETDAPLEAAPAEEEPAAAPDAPADETAVPEDPSLS